MKPLSIPLYRARPASRSRQQERDLLSRDRLYESPERSRGIGYCESRKRREKRETTLHHPAFGGPACSINAAIWRCAGS